MSFQSSFKPAMLHYIEIPLQMPLKTFGVISKGSSFQMRYLILKDSVWMTVYEYGFKFQRTKRIYLALKSVSRSVFFCWNIAVIFSETFSDFGHWNISVICLTVVKLTIAMFFSLGFQTFWLKWVNFCSVISKMLWSWLKKL